jgi:hypothetical protein
MISALYNIFGLVHYIQRVEIDRSVFDTSPHRVRPLEFDTSKRLNLTGIQLAHALVKADCYQRQTFEWWKARAFLVQHHDLFDWESRELRTVKDASSLYFDFVGTSLAGRVGNALTLLHANDMGLPFQCHFKTFLKQNPPSSSVTLPSRQPDFVCGSTSSLAIFEAKGSFPKEGRPTDVSGDLFEGLQQLGGWSNILAITKGFACASYIKETGDPNPEGSMLCFVDPDEGNSLPRFDFGVLDLLRENYASWFVAMGLPDVAQRLRFPGSSAPIQHNFLVLAFDVNPIDRRLIAFADDDFDDHKQRQILGDNFELPRIGIELKVLESIPWLIDGTIEDVLGNVFASVSYSQSDANGNSVSLFPDGSYMGAIPRSSFSKLERHQIII